MKIFRNIGIAVTLFMFTTSLSAQEKLHTTKIDNFSQLLQHFHYQDNKPVIISGHRGGMMTGFPENSIETMHNTLSYTPSFFEIDPQLTKDSIMILMHDKTLDRTTNMKGNVKDFTYAQLKKAKLKDRQGNITSFSIPTLKETLDWGSDKTIFNLDNKGVPWSMYVDFFNTNKYSNIVLSVRSMEEATYYYNNLDDVMLCIAIKNVQDLEAFKATGIPYNRIIAYVGYTMDDKHQQVYDFLRKKGVMCFISIHPTADKQREDINKLKAYTEELIKRPDIIETDYPVLFNLER